MAKGKIDFNRQIGLYPNADNEKEYLRTIRHIELLFSGKKSVILKELERDMKRAAKAQSFEEADMLKKRMFALRHIQDIALIKERDRIHRDDRTIRFEAYDIAHISGTSMVGVMTVVESGEMQKSEYRKFKINTVSGSNDPKALGEVIERRLGHDEWPMPQYIVVDGSTPQKNAVERILKSHGMHIPVMAVVKDEHHRPKKILGPSTMVSAHEREILLANAEAHRFAINYHRNLRSKSMRMSGGHSQDLA